MLREEVKQIKMQTSKGKKIDHEMYVYLCPMNEKENCVKNMKSWIKKSRIFRENAKDYVQQDIRKFGMII